MSVNKVLLIGNLGRDPEVRFTSNGKAVARFSIATSEVWSDTEGSRQERTEWHNIVVWGKQAETCGQYLSKGRQVYIEGQLRTRTYDDKDGVKKYITEITAQRVQFLGSGSGGGGGGGSRGGGSSGSSGSDGGGGGGSREGGSSGSDDFPPPNDDDIPF